MRILEMSSKEPVYTLVGYDVQHVLIDYDFIPPGTSASYSSTHGLEFSLLSIARCRRHRSGILRITVRKSKSV